MSKPQAKVVPRISMVGWHLALIGEQPDNGGPPPLLSQGQIISEIGKASWMVQFFGKQVYMRVLSEEQLGDFAIFPNQQMAGAFLEDFYSQWKPAEEPPAEGDTPEVPPITADNDEAGAGTAVAAEVASD